MIKYTNDSIINAKEKVLVNPINAQARLTYGVNKLFKEHFPLMASTLIKEEPFIPVGDYYLFEERDKLIVNLSYKSHWKEVPPKINHINQALKSLLKLAIESNWQEIAIPKIGCEKGYNMEWEEVKSLVENVFKDAPVTLVIYG